MEEPVSREALNFAGRANRLDFLSDFCRIEFTLEAVEPLRIALLKPDQNNVEATAQNRPLLLEPMTRGENSIKPIAHHFNSTLGYISFVVIFRRNKLNWDLVELLKMPTCVREVRRVILDQLGNRHGRRFDRHWDFVRYAQEQRLDLDFTTPPKRPEAKLPPLFEE